jgi:molybdopterin synthase catalytic subunit
VREMKIEVNMVIVTESSLDPSALYAKLHNEDAGSVIFHYAVVKSQAAEKQTSGIRFETNGDMEAELSAIENDIMKRWNLSGVLLVRRIGTLQVGDIISLVAVSSPASSDAFEACQYGLSRLRKMQNIIKTELYTDQVKS